MNHSIHITSDHMIASSRIDTVLDGLRALGLRIVYGLFGVAGLALWLLMQLPMSERLKEMLAMAMAGSLGMCALGWGVMSQQAQGQG